MSQQHQHRGPMGRGMQMGGAKAKDFKGSFAKLLKYMGKYKVSLILVLFFAIASTVFHIIGPKILGEATNKLTQGIMAMVQGSGGGIDFVAIGTIIAVLLGLYVVSLLFGYLQGYLMAGISMKVTHRLRIDISNKIHRLPFRFYDTTTTGEVLSYKIGRASCRERV